jgi:hypothetical protein
MRLISGAVLLALLGSITYVVLKKHNPYLFKRSKKFVFYMREAQGIEEGTPVWVKGLDAGEVIEMTLEEVPATFLGGKPVEGKVLAVKVTCRVFSPFHELLRQRTTVEVLLLSVFGKPRVHVFPSAPSTPPIANGAVLGQHISRGLEGKAETYLDQSEALNRKFMELTDVFDDLQRDTEDIERRYREGRNTWFALMEKGEESAALKRAAKGINSSAKAIQASIDELNRNINSLGKKPFLKVEEDWETVRKTFLEAGGIGEEAIDPWEVFFENFNAFCAHAKDTVDRAKRFHVDLRVFLNAKDVFFPRILAHWYEIRRDLVEGFVQRVKIATLPIPRIEEYLQAIRLGRLKREVKRSPTDGEDVAPVRKIR